MRTLDGGMTVKSRLHEGLLCGATIISLHGWAFKDLLLGRVVLYKNEADTFQTGIMQCDLAVIIIRSNPFEHGKRLSLVRTRVATYNEWRHLFFPQQDPGGINNTLSPGTVPHISMF